MEENRKQSETVPIKKENAKSFFSNLFSLHDNMANPEDIHNSIEAGAQIHGSNMCILILAIIIASIGLNMGSTAVVIGAMLISPLMNSIMAIGYGLATADMPLVKKAASRFAIQIIICIVTSTLYFFISPISTPSAEILARTSPTIWDVIIAISGGIAGAIGGTRKEKTNVIPGVAIATALMPPLCTAGYGLATANAKFFFGAFYLFFINCFFISLSMLVVVLLLKLPAKKIVGKKARHKLVRSITVIAVITIIPSIFIASNIVMDTVISSKYNSYINNEFVFEDTQIVQSSISEDDKTISVALIGSTISDDVIEVLKSKLDNYGLANYDLQITQTVVSEGMTTEQMQALIESEINTQNDSLTMLLLQEQVANLQKELDKAHTSLENYENDKVDFSALCQKAKTVFPDIKDCSLGIHYGMIDKQNGIENTQYLLMTVQCDEPMSESTKTYINNWLSAETGYKNTLLIEYVNEPETVTTTDINEENGVQVTG